MTDSTEKKLIIDDWYCICCQTKGNLKYMTDQTIVCKNTNLMFNRSQAKQLSKLIGEKHE